MLRAECENDVFIPTCHFLSPLTPNHVQVEALSSSQQSLGLGVPPSGRVSASTPIVAQLPAGGGASAIGAAEKVRLAARGV